MQVSETLIFSWNLGFHHWPQILQSIFLETVFASFIFETMSSSTCLSNLGLCVSSCFKWKWWRVSRGLVELMTQLHKCLSSSGRTLPCTVEVPTPARSVPRNVREMCMSLHSYLPLLSLYPCYNKAVCAHTTSSWLLSKMISLSFGFTCQVMKPPRATWQPSHAFSGLRALCPGGWSGYST